jgi:hypothetical protein
MMLRHNAMRRLFSRPVSSSRSLSCLLQEASGVLKDPEANPAVALRQAWKELQLSRSYEVCRQLALPKEFVKHLSAPEPQVQTEACLAVVICAGDEATALELVKLGVLPPLLGIVSSVSSAQAGLRAGGTLALGNLANHPSVAQAVWNAENDGSQTLEVLQQHLSECVSASSPSEPIIRATLEAISSCMSAVTAEERGLAHETGLVDVFAQLVASNQWTTETQIGLFYSVQNTLASQRENQIAFAEAGGIKQVVLLLQSITEELQGQPEVQLLQSKFELIEGERMPHSSLYVYGCCVHWRCASSVRWTRFVTSLCFICSCELGLGAVDQLTA